MNKELFDAISSGNLEALEELLATDVNIKQKDENGATALLLAAYNGHVKVVKFLLTNKHSQSSEKDNSGNTALLLAAFQGKIPVLKYLLSKPEVSLLEKNTAEGDNVLSFAAWNGQLDAITFLLKQGAYIDLLRNDGRTACQLIQTHSNKVALPVLQVASTLLEMAKNGSS